MRTGVLTDGKYWLLRWPGAGAVKTVRPYAFTLQDAQGWLPLFEWLRDEALVSLEGIPPDRGNIEKHLGPNSPRYERDIAALRMLFQENSHYETIKVKRQLWFDLLRAALGEVAASPEQLDDLFVRHTYLSMVIGMVVQASFGIDIRQVAASDPADLLHGRAFWNATGLQGIVESDFFAWPTEVGGLPSIRALARRIAKFDWRDAPADIAAALYETVIPPEERRTLGEYYTPGWLARVMVRELVTDPLNQRVLDPACGSGTFIAEAVTHYIEAAKIEAAKGSGQHPKQVLDRLLESVAGIDVHPVAVHLARAAWVLAARPAIDAVMEAGFVAQVSVPIYLGDALQLRFQTGDMFAAHNVTIQVADEQNTELVFPASLVERANDFDSLMSDIASYIENKEDPNLALDDNHINDPSERETLAGTIATLQMLHSQGRDHIWAYYTRNLVRPVALARRKVDVIIGNPPWINYNQTRQHPAGRAGAPEQGAVRHLAGRPVRHPSGCGRAVLHPQHGPVLEGRRTHRHGDAPQRVADRTVRQVAHRRLAGPPERHRTGGGLHLEGRVGPGAVGAQHLLPCPGGGVFAQARGHSQPGRPPIRQRGTMVGQGRGGGRAARECNYY